MAVITRITRQKNDKARFSIYLDDGNGEKFAFGADEDVLIRFNLRKGLVLDGDTIEMILHSNDVKKATNLCLSFLTYRMRSEQEVIQYMKKKQVDPSVIPIVIEQLRSQSYLNDLEFAKSYVRDKKRMTIKGVRLLSKELSDKGISEKYIEQALKEYSEDEQVEVATRFAIKKREQHRQESNNQISKKLGQQLLQKGFEYDVIQSVLHDLPKKSDEEELNVLREQAKKAHRRYYKYSGHDYRQRMKQYLFRKGFAVSQIEQVLNELKAD